MLDVEDVGVRERILHHILHKTRVVLAILARLALVHEQQLPETALREHTQVAVEDVRLDLAIPALESLLVVSFDELGNLELI